MKRAYVVVEGQSDVDLLKKVLLAESQKDVEFIPAGGSMYLDQLASSLAARRRTAVAIFMDADSLNPEVIDERRANIEESIKLSAGGVPVKVIAMVPELESCFFAAPRVIEHVLKTKIPENLIPLGKRDPKGILELLDANSKNKWDVRRAIDAINLDDMMRIREIPAIQELTAFLQSLPAIKPVSAAK